MSLRAMADYPSAFGEADAIPVADQLEFGPLVLPIEKIQADPLPNSVVTVAILTTKA